MKKETVWIIVNQKFGAYMDMSLRRKEAIAKHLQGRTWDQCKSNGDRAVKITIKYPLQP